MFILQNIGKGPKFQLVKDSGWTNTLKFNNFTLKYPLALLKDVEIGFRI